MNPIIRGCLFAVTILAAAMAAGCTVQPLLAKNPGGMGAPGFGETLSSVTIKPVGTRYAQQVRNNLIFLLHGGAAEPAQPRYSVNLVVTRRQNKAATVQLKNEEESTAETMTLTARYIITDAKTGKNVATGTRAITSAYDVPLQEYAVYRAEIDAENRAARELAEVLRLSIAQDLRRLPAAS